MKWLDDFINLLYPRNCITCGEQLLKEEEHLCFPCISDLPYTGHINMKDNPVKKIFSGRINIHHASAWLQFEKSNKSQAIMHSLKYRKNPDIGYYLGKIMGMEIKNSALYSGLQAIIPIPIHKSKLRERGYNQSDYIARGISEELNVVVLNDAIFRKLKTSSQTKKKRYERWENVQSVFQVKKEVIRDIEHLLLVDDVITTGATIESCGHQLASCHKMKISVITLARSN